MKDKQNEAWEVTGVDTLSKAKDLSNEKTDTEIPTIANTGMFLPLFLLLHHESF